MDRIGDDTPPPARMPVANAAETAAAADVAGQSVPRPSVSVVINTMARLETLKACLAGLRRQWRPSFDVVVVVGPDSADSLRFISEQHPDVTVVFCPLANLAVSRNLGWRHAAGDLIGYIDDDAIPLPNWIERLAEAFCDPKVGAAGGFVRDHTGGRWQWQFLTVDPLSNPIEVTAAEYHGPLVTDGPIDPAEPRFKYPAGTNMMFRRAALEEVGGFDEGFVYAADDADLCLRLYAARWSIAHVPSAEVLHRYAPSHQRHADRVPRSLLDTVRSFVYFKFRHGRRYLPSDAVVASVKDYVARTESWVGYLEGAGRLDHTAAKRLLGEIQQGAREGGLNALMRSATPAPITAALELPKTQARFAVMRALPRRLRVCLVSRELPPLRSGGIGLWQWTLARQLARLGHEIHVIAESAIHPTMDFIDGCWVHRAPTPSYGLRGTPDLGDLPPFIRDNAYRVFDTVARLEAADGPFDVVSAPVWEAQGIALLRGRAGLGAVSLHTPMRMIIRTSRGWTPDEAWLQSYGRPLMAAEAELVSRSPLVLANSLAIVEAIEREYSVRISRDRLAIVPHGVDDVPAEAESEPVRPFRKLLFVGRFEGRKGADILLDALPELMVRHPDLIAELCGDNSFAFADGTTLWGRFCQRHAAELWFRRVRPRGHVNEPELLEAYRTCDVFVAPSRFESFGLIFIEAMRFGKPVVALDIGAAREIIDPGSSGLLVRGEDPRQLADALSRLLADPALRTRMGRNARAAFEQRFTAAAMAESVVEAFLRSLHGTGRHAVREAASAALALRKAPELSAERR